MTKRFCIFTILLMGFIAMHAQSIVGTWKNTMTEDGMKIDIYYVFTQKTVIIKFSAEIQNAELGSFVFTTIIPSTYTKKGNKIALKTQNQDVKMTMDKMELVSNIQEIASQNPEFKKMIEDQMNQLMEQSMKEIVGELSEEGELTILRNDGVNLTVRDKSGNDMNFIKEK